MYPDTCQLGNPTTILAPYSEVIPHLIWQGTHLALYQLDNPESADLEHRVGVVPATFCLEINKQTAFCEQLINMIY